MRSAHHLHDERLFDCYLAERAGEAVDPPSAEHLADCDACAVRYTDLIAFMNTLRAEGEAEADAVFTPERLHAQQQQIARRIEQAARPARVISFPGQFVRRTISASSRTPPRWVAAAAAAGLFIGIAVGASFEWETHVRDQQTFARGPQVNRPAMFTTGTTRGASVAEPDAAFLDDLELALERPRTRELVAFDEFTPHVRDIRDIR
jgi:hypothetical protein